MGECPFVTPAEAQQGLTSPSSKAFMALHDRCGGENEDDGLEMDCGGALKDAASLVRSCLQINTEDRPNFEQILECRFLSGCGTTI